VPVYLGSFILGEFFQLQSCLIRILKRFWHHLLVTYLLNWYPVTVCV